VASTRLDENIPVCAVDSTLPGPTRFGQSLGEESRASYSIGIWLAILSAFGFSFKAILIKLAYALPQAAPVAPVTLLTLRMIFALPFFLWVARRESLRGAPLSRKDLIGVVVLGLFGYYGASIFDFIGLCYITAGLERLVLFTYPTLTILLDLLVFGKRITGRQVGALVLCYLGIALAFAHDLELAPEHAVVWIGGGFVFASSLCYALYLSGGAQVMARIGSSRFAALALLWSTVATLGHFAATQPVSALIQPWPIYALGLAMGTFCTVVPVFALAAAIRRIGSGPAALIGTLGPMLTIALGWWILAESISLFQIGGALLVIAGVVLVGRKGRRTTSAVPSPCMD